MSILEILEAHKVSAFCGSDTACSCDRTWRSNAAYRAHVAEVLLEHERDAKAEALEAYASGLEIRLAGATRRYGKAVIEGHDIIRELRDRAAQIKDQS